MVVYGIWVINKAGGLVFQRNYAGLFVVLEASVPGQTDQGHAINPQMVFLLLPQMNILF